VLKVVKGTERLVNVSHSLVLDLIDNKLVVLECKVVVDFLDVRVKPLSQINLDIILDLLQVLLDNDRVGQVCVELLKAVEELANLL